MNDKLVMTWNETNYQLLGAFPAEIRGYIQVYFSFILDLN